MAGSQRVWHAGVMAGSQRVWQVKWLVAKI